MSADSSANTSFDERPTGSLTPDTGLNPPLGSSISTPGNAISETTASKFKLFEDITTPLQRSTNLLNQNASTAPPFLRNRNDVSLASQISADLTEIDLAIGALDLGFGANGISTTALNAAGGDSKKPVIHEKVTKEDTSISGAVEVDSTNAEKGTVDSTFTSEGAPLGNDPNQFNKGDFSHHQPFPPFFPINGFGQPVHGGFSPGETLDHPPLSHPQPWSAKPGQPHFPNGLNGAGLDSLAHTPPIPHPGMIPMGHFDFGPDGVTPPLPPHLHGEAFINLGAKDENSLKDMRHSPFAPPGGFPNIDASFNNQHGLRNNQLWPPINGNPQPFDNSFANMGGISPNGLGHNNSNARFYPNGGNGSHHTHHNNNNNNHNHGRKFGGQRRRGEDASKFANAKLEDFIGQIYSLCKDQHGCRFLQKQLDVDSKNATVIFQEIHSYVIELMVDPFGNYLIQKLLENVNNEERITLVKIASSQFVQIALDSHGTRALQKLVECIDSQEEAKIIVDSLKDDVVSLSTDLNGNHVIQKCLQRLTPFDSQFIFDAAAKSCLEIAVHRHGCCVLQRSLDFGSAEQCNELSLCISKYAKELSLDPYGNYVIQYVLSKDADDEAARKIVDVVKSNIVEFSLHKFGSNVLEKCLKATKYNTELIDDLITHEHDLVTLLNDSFGNYVLQTSLDVAKGKQFDKLASILKPLLPQVRNTPHGRRISTRLQQTVLR